MPLAFCRIQIRIGHKRAKGSIDGKIMHCIGASPSGKAAAFGAAIRWFESNRPAIQ